MADHDPGQERQRLTKLYTAMSDGELDAIAADAAELPDAALDSAEIECFLVDDNMARIEWSNLVGGIKLCVKQEDAEAALDMLEQPIPEEFDVDGVGP